MRKGLVAGAQSTVETVVAENMVAQLGGQKIHPVLATAQMIEWMEWAGRKVILPFLEDDEEAVGYAVDIIHLAPTLVGENFMATATFRAFEDNRIVTDVVAQNQRGIIGRGVFTQVLLPKKALSDRLAKLQANPSQGPVVK